MPESRALELIHRRIDGELESPEKEELNRVLQKEPDARELLDDLRLLDGVLSELGEATPAADLRARIMDEVRTATPPSSKRRFAGVVDLRKRRERLVLRLGIGLAAVLLLAIILAPALLDDLDPSRVGGSMTEPEPAAVPVSVIEIPAAAGGGLIHVNASGNRVIVEISETAGASLRLGFDPASLQLLESRGASVSAEPGDIIIQTRPETPARLVLSRKPGSFPAPRIRLTAGEPPRFVSTIQIPNTNF